MYIHTYVIDSNIFVWVTIRKMNLFKRKIANMKTIFLIQFKIFIYDTLLI